METKRVFFIMMVVLSVFSIDAQVYFNKNILESCGPWYYVNNNTGELLTSIGVVYDNGVIKAKTIENGKVKITNTKTLYYFTDSIDSVFDCDIYKQKKTGKYLVQKHIESNDIQFFEVKILNDTSIEFVDVKRPKKSLYLKSKRE